jgi:hypothetical protein
VREHGPLGNMHDPRNGIQMLTRAAVGNTEAVPALVDIAKRAIALLSMPSRTPNAALTSHPDLAAYTPVVGACSMSSASSSFCRPGSQSPKRVEKVSGSAGSSSFSARSKRMSSPNIAAFSGAWPVHPIARNSAA